MRRNRYKKKTGVLSVPMTVEGAKQNQCGVTAEGAQGAALPRGTTRIQHRVCGTRKPASSAGGRRGNPPKARGFPRFPRTPLSALPPTQGRAARHHRLRYRAAASTDGNDHPPGDTPVQRRARSEE